MGEARINEIDALRQFRTAIIKFIEIANVALGDAESDLQRTLGWVEHEQTQFWTSESRKRQEGLEKAKEALRMKQIYKSPSGARQSTVEEEKAVLKAKMRIEEAQQKLINCKKYARILEKALHNFKGSMQRLSTSVSVDMRVAAAHLDQMFKTLQEYTSLAPTAAGGLESATSEAGGMKRASLSVFGAEMATAAGQNGPDPLEMRTGTPPLVERDTAPVEDVPSAPWAAGQVSDEQIEILKKINPKLTGVRTVERLTYGVGFQTAQVIYFERLKATGPEDSGWYIGAGTAVAPDAVRAATVGQVLAARPDLKEILLLPTRSIAVVGPKGVSAVIDEGANDLWAEATMPVAEAAGGSETAANAAGADASITTPAANG